jgi:hypothetical protein
MISLVVGKLVKLARRHKMPDMYAIPKADGSVYIVVRVAPDFFGVNIRIQFLICND